VLAGRAAAFADYERLTYCEQVVAESMRLYPPAWAMGRRAIADVAFDGFVFPKGSVFIVSPYVTHRSEEYWPDPERFDPERFAPAAKESRPKLAYLPFGFGPRICIGERFAWMEAVLLLATLAQRWRFRAAPDQTMTPEPLITLRPKERLRMVCEPRG
jgi:cytochrome P450